MKKQIIIHLMTKERLNIEQFEVELECMEDLKEKYDISNLIFYKGEEFKGTDLLFSRLSKIGLILDNYLDDDGLINKVNFLKEKYDILFVYTEMELLIGVTNKIRKSLGHVLSDEPKIFRDKFLQRELIQENNPEIGIKFRKGDPETFDIKKIENFILYPFILKPIYGIQSSGVWKITSREDFDDYLESFSGFKERIKARGMENKEIIIEEYVDGNMYSIDYFVDKNQNIVFTKPVKVELGINFGINDFCNISRFCSKKIEKELDFERVKQFVKDTVKASKIRNTFIHHEFKHTTKDKFKTIELNGRIGGGRVGLIGESFKVNLFEMLINSNFEVGEIRENNCIYYIYPEKRARLKGFNNDLFQKIKNLSSFEKLDLDDSFIGEEIGLTKDGFTKVGRIKLKNADSEKYEKDYSFIKDNYKRLLILE